MERAFGGGSPGGECDQVVFDRSQWLSWVTDFVKLIRLVWGSADTCHDSCLCKYVCVRARACVYVCERQRERLSPIYECVCVLCAASNMTCPCNQSIDFCFLLSSASRFIWENATKSQTALAAAHDGERPLSLGNTVADQADKNEISSGRPRCRSP